MSYYGVRGFASYFNEQALASQWNFSIFQVFKYFLILLIILGLLIRFPIIFSGTIAFHYDTARDAFMALEIWNLVDFKIQGPPTTLPGLFHGVFYYYLLAPFYGLGNGDPRVPAVFIAILNTLTVIPVMLLAKSFFKSNFWVILSGLLYIISYEVTEYSGLLANPTPALTTVVLFFYFLKKAEEGRNKWSLPSAALFAGLSAQFQFFLIYLYLVLILFIFIFKIKINKTLVFRTVLLGSVGLISYAVSLIKFRGGLDPSSNLIERLNPLNFKEAAEVYIHQLISLFTNNLFPGHYTVGIIIILVTLFFIRKDKFLLFCLFSNAIIFILGGHRANYSYIGLVVIAIIAFLKTVKGLNQKIKYIPLLLVGFSISANLLAIKSIYTKGQVDFTIQDGLLLKKELELIDKSYEIADGKEFSINSLNQPLWTNTTWAYLYKYFGEKKYGYLPKYYGPDQIGVPGDGILEKIPQPLLLSFNIVEDRVGINAKFFRDELTKEGFRTKIIREYPIGELILQHRTPVDPK